MPAPWESPLRRWVEAGLIDGQAEGRIRAWEAAQPERQALRWPAWLALGFGGLLLGAGILLFVAAHWQGLDPLERFLLIPSLVVALHLAGAFASPRSPGLSATLHACGTAALGAGIFLAGQIFHLEEHWPGGVMLWAVGAAAGWWLLRQWPQAAMVALLAPAWLVSEWIVATHGRRGAGALTSFVLLLSLAYLAAEPSHGRQPAVRRALVWLGGLAFIPAAMTMIIAVGSTSRTDAALSMPLAAVGWALAIGAPLAVGTALRRSNLVPLAIAALWTCLGVSAASAPGVVPHVWCAVLSIGLIAWGLRDRRAERVNLGVAGFALTVVFFYFSDVMDKLGRSASLIGLGLLFLGGGYLLEQARRRLLLTMSGLAR